MPVSPFNRLLHGALQSFFYLCFALFFVSPRIIFRTRAGKATGCCDLNHTTFTPNLARAEGYMFVSVPCCLCFEKDTQTFRACQEANPEYFLSTILSPFPDTLVQPRNRKRYLDIDNTKIPVKRAASSSYRQRAIFSLAGITAKTTHENFRTRYHQNNGMHFRIRSIKRAVSVILLRKASYGNSVHQRDLQKNCNHHPHNARYSEGISKQGIL